jgi:hypothetical protein
MRVRCIHNESVYGFADKSDSLTLGKIYDADISDEDDGFYVIEDDNGVNTEYSTHRFINISEHRDKLLNDIGL